MVEENALARQGSAQIVSELVGQGNLGGKEQDTAAALKAVPCRSDVDSCLAGTGDPEDQALGVLVLVNQGVELVHSCLLVGIKLEGNAFRGHKKLCSKLLYAVFRLFGRNADAAELQKGLHNLGSSLAQLPHEGAPVGCAVEHEVFQGLALPCGSRAHWPGRGDNELHALALGRVPVRRNQESATREQLLHKGLFFPWPKGSCLFQGKRSLASLDVESAHSDTHVTREWHKLGDGKPHCQTLAACHSLKNAHKSRIEDGDYFQGEGNIAQPYPLRSLDIESTDDPWPQGASAQGYGNPEAFLPEVFREGLWQGIGQIRVGRLKQGDKSVHWVPKPQPRPPLRQCAWLWFCVSLEQASPRLRPRAGWLREKMCRCRSRFPARLP